MMQHRALYSLIGATVMLASLSGYPALAELQPEARTGSLIVRKPQVVDPRKSALALKGFAKCVYQTKRKFVESLLDHSDPITVDFNATGFSSSEFSKSLLVEECLRREIKAEQAALEYKFRPISLRARLLEEAYLDKFPRTPDAPAEGARVVDRKYVSAGTDLPRALALGEFSDCVVFKNSAGADALLRAQPRSEQELAAARLLGPALGACLVLGQKLVLRPPLIREIVADGLWTRYVKGTLPMSASAK
jgi:hypothetical protein